MAKFKGKYRIDTTRLKSWDYTTPWWYFITICTHHKAEHFCSIDNNKIILNEPGVVAKQCWQEIPDHYKFVELDTFIIMPNHIHGIIIINEQDVNTNDNNGISKSISKCRDVACNVSTEENFYSRISPRKKSLSIVIRS